MSLTKAKVWRLGHLQSYDQLQLWWGVPRLHWSVYFRCVQVRNSGEIANRVIAGQSSLMGTECSANAKKVHSDCDREVSECTVHCSLLCMRLKVGNNVQVSIRTEPRSRGGRWPGLIHQTGSMHVTSLWRQFGPCSAGDVASEFPGPQSDRASVECA